MSSCNKFLSVGCNKDSCAACVLWHSVYAKGMHVINVLLYATAVVTSSVAMATTIFHYCSVPSKHLCVFGTHRPKIGDGCLHGEAICMYNQSTYCMWTIGSSKLGSGCLYSQLKDTTNSAVSLPSSACSAFSGLSMSGNQTHYIASNHSLICWPTSQEKVCHTRQQWRKELQKPGLLSLSCYKQVFMHARTNIIKNLLPVLVGNMGRQCTRVQYFPSPAARENTCTHRAIPTHIAH